MKGKYDIDFNGVHNGVEFDSKKITLKELKKFFKKCFHKGVRYDNDGCEGFGTARRVELLYKGKNYVFTAKPEVDTKKYIREKL